MTTFIFLVERYEYVRISGSERWRTSIICRSRWILLRHNIIASGNLFDEHWETHRRWPRGRAERRRKCAQQGHSGRLTVNNGQAAKEKQATGPNQSQESLLWNLQWRFFSAYFLAIFADWLQGPYIYQLYSSYGFAEKEIAVLFLTGFASSSTFGTFTGPLADKFGRKSMTQVFCLLYSLSCIIKFSSNLWH